MAKVWITYAWEDNKYRDVDFLAQELSGSGIEVKLDRWNITAGKRLWEQIEYFIQNENQCDAWIFYVTENSLGSEACKEEYSYALDRALNNRGKQFPIIGLFQGHVNRSIIPAGIKSRLYVSTNDVDWKERIKAASESRDPDIAKANLLPYYLKYHPRGRTPLFDGNIEIIEVRPRAGTWYPTVIGIPMDERKGHMIVIQGPTDTPPDNLDISSVYEGECKLNDVSWWVNIPRNETTVFRSTYYLFDKHPTKLLFGCEKGPFFSVDFQKGKNSKA